MVKFSDNRWPHFTLNYFLPIKSSMSPCLCSAFTSLAALQWHPPAYHILSFLCLSPILPFGPCFRLSVCVFLSVCLCVSVCVSVSLFLGPHLSSVFKHNRLFRVAGAQVPAGVGPPDHGLQRVPDLGHRGLLLAAALRPAGQAGQDQRLGRSHQQPLRVAAGREHWRAIFCMQVGLN